jgi:hypothetical protein
MLIDGFITECVGPCERDRDGKLFDGADAVASISCSSGPPAWRWLRVGSGTSSWVGTDVQSRANSIRLHERAAIGELLTTFTPEECANYFRSSGYAAT